VDRRGPRRSGEPKLFMTGTGRKLWELFIALEDQFVSGQCVFFVQFPSNTDENPEKQNHARGGGEFAARISE